MNKPPTSTAISPKNSRAVANYLDYTRPLATALSTPDGYGGVYPTEHRDSLTSTRARRVAAIDPAPRDVLWTLLYCKAHYHIHHHTHRTQAERGWLQDELASDVLEKVDIDDYARHPDALALISRRVQTKLIDQIRRTQTTKYLPLGDAAPLHEGLAAPDSTPEDLDDLCRYVASALSSEMLVDAWGILGPAILDGSHRRGKTHSIERLREEMNITRAAATDLYESLEPAAMGALYDTY